MNLSPDYPTPAHAQAAESVVEFFSSTMPEVDTVILNGSCARGRATRDSCLDILVLVPPDILDSQEAHLYHCWSEFCETEMPFEELAQMGRGSRVDLTYIDGMFRPQANGQATGPDTFELAIGSALVYAIPLWERGSRYQRLRAEWLPYYGEALRRERLAMVRRTCRDGLEQAARSARRGLEFRAFTQLHDAFRAFLQALFIARRTYPIAYDQWIRDQVVDILDLPELYGQLTHLFEIVPFESSTVAHKVEHLAGLLEDYTHGG